MKKLLWAAIVLSIGSWSAAPVLAQQATGDCPTGQMRDASGVCVSDADMGTGGAATGMGATGGTDLGTGTGTGATGSMGTGGTDMGTGTTLPGDTGRGGSSQGSSSGGSGSGG